MTLTQKFSILLILFTFFGCSQQAQPTETSPGVTSHPPEFEEILRAEKSSDFSSQSYLSETTPGFPITSGDNATSIVISTSDHQGVQQVATHLQRDIALVTGVQPNLFTDSLPERSKIILIGSLDSSIYIQQLVSAGKLDGTDLKGKWEKFIIQIVKDPFPGVDEALVIAGSDKRGTIYGMYDLSEEMGVSPWYWWADVPVDQHENIYVKAGKHTLGEPKVKYRGIFINDEAPALTGWAYEKFGGFNHLFYERVYELVLRMKGNYLWPAMWGKAIYDDDPKSPELADMYGVVIGTSHHEPLMRAHVEWERYGSGPWNYDTNEETLREFWRKGIERMGDNESLVTIGMRGDGDEPMTEGTAIALLEKIVSDQREIIADVTGKPAKETPQIWALYKEVQDYYDKGMRVPDDVTLLLCDDNWGNIRKLPQLGDTLRPGGYGIYYHFDYVGGPRNYKWINTTQISRVWEQMHLAYEYGARQVWIVNVGDIKPMEFPTSFFLDYAWNPDVMPAEDVPPYGVRWAAEQFGAEYAEEIADILHKYTQFNSRRKPELLSPDTYSLTNYREFERVVEDYNELAARAESIGDRLPDVYQSAYFQLVAFPVKASANLNEMYFVAAKNRLYAAQGRALTNELAHRVEELFAKDQELTEQYHSLMNGKWNHMMSQTHIGYTYWQQPEEQTMPEVERIKLRNQNSFGLAVEGSEVWWPKSKTKAQLPTFDSHHDQEYYIELFNRGTEPFDYQISEPSGTLSFSEAKGTVDKQTRVTVRVNWDKVEDQQLISFQINGPTETVEVFAQLNKVPDDINGNVAFDGTILLNAADFTSKISTEAFTWKVIPQLGRTRSAMTAIPVAAKSVEPGGDSPHLEYEIWLPKSGEVSVKAYFSPTLNFHNTKGLRYAVSFNDETPQIINVHDDFSFKDWEDAVSSNIIVTTSNHQLSAGPHTLKYYLVDPGLTLQKLEVVTDEEKESYLGATAKDR